MMMSRQISLGALLLLSTLTASAQISSAGPAPPGTTPLSSLIATVAKKTGRKFVLDPRVRANVMLVGEDPSSVTYNQLQTILNTYGFIAVDSGGLVAVVPDAYARMEPLPLISGNEKFPDDEYVTAVLHVKSLPAEWLVPILRPLVPQTGHFVALECDNDLLIVDRYAAVRRMEAIVKAMDTGAPIRPRTCSPAVPSER